MRLRVVLPILGISVSIALMFFIHPGRNPAKAAVEFDPNSIQLVEVGAGLNQPLVIANAGDGSGRLFVVERAGRIRILKNGVLIPTPFLDIDTIVNSSSGEQGLLALAFHPDYVTNGLFYTVHTSQDGSLVLARFTRSQNNPDLANANSMVPLLTIPHPTHTNHNGGTLVFGPDGYLYWSTGDGGGAGDTANNAQNLTVLLGKILRLNVNSGSPYDIPVDNPFVGHSNQSVRREIWAYGLRNPWRISFDRQTGDLYIGDVGQGAREEIDFQPAASAGGENYGWRVMEGSLCYNPSSGCEQSGKVLPVAEYDHSLGCSVTGGHVYRGNDFPILQGYYFYGDFCSGRLFVLQNAPGTGWESFQLLDTAYLISTFGEDEQEELYLADYRGGRIYQLRYSSFTDVPSSHPYWEDIEILYANGLTAGCSTSPLMFCPNDIMNRAQSAVFMVRGMLGAGYMPSFPVHKLGDNWTLGSWAEPWAEAIIDEELSTGCSTSPLLYCPWEKLPREQVVIFGLKMKYGANYQPPAATGTLFSDMTDPNYYATKWAEKAYSDGLLPACGTSGGKPLFCPSELVTRGLGAYVIVRAKNLSMP
jgi:glucose/arabinose dehydrogenase